MEPLEEILETIDVEHVPEGNPLKGRFLVFRKWAPGDGNYSYYYAISPGETWGMLVRLNYNSMTDPEKKQIPYEITRVTMDSVLASENVEATEEEFLEAYMTAMAEIKRYMNFRMRLIS